MSTPAIHPQLAGFCPACGHNLRDSALACDFCHTLTHARELESLATQARAAETAGDIHRARDLWNQSLHFLPRDSTQAAWIQDKLRVLQPSGSVDDPSANPATKQKNTWARKLGPLGPIAIVLAKSKGLLAAVFKLKFLLSLFSFVALYWALFGWRFGVGFAAAILIHELGHYFDIKRRGWPAEMPVFLPGLGAYVRWQALGVTVEQRAQVSLAGPLAGWIAAAVCYLLYVKTANPLWSALARTGAVLNALNLIPIWTLDGGQAANALARPERLALLATALILWAWTGEGIYFLVAAGVVWRLLTKDLPPKSSWPTLAYYAAVLAALGVVLKALPASAVQR